MSQTVLTVIGIISRKWKTSDAVGILKVGLWCCGEQFQGTVNKI